MVGNPIEMYFDGKYGQLIVKDMKGSRISLHIINDCENKPRSINFLWGADYFPPKNASTTFRSKLDKKLLEQLNLPTKFLELSSDDQKAESANMFSRRDKPLEFYINSKYKNIINFATNIYTPILITEIINKFENVLVNLNIENNWKISEIQKTSWQFTNECEDFQGIKNIPCSAADLSSYHNGKAELTNGTNKIDIICPDLTDGSKYGVQIIYNNMESPSIRNTKHALDKKIPDRFREILATIKTSEENKGENISMKKLFNKSYDELKSS